MLPIGQKYSLLMLLKYGILELKYFFLAGARACKKKNSLQIIEEYGV